MPAQEVAAARLRALETGRWVRPGRAHRLQRGHRPPGPGRSSRAGSAAAGGAAAAGVDLRTGRTPSCRSARPPWVVALGSCSAGCSEQT